jgi:hypothetical protein
LNTYTLKTEADIAIPQPKMLKNLVLFEKGKAVPLQTWTGPEGSRRMSLPDFKTTAHEVGKVVSRMHRSPLPPQKIFLVLISVTG